MIKEEAKRVAEAQHSAKSWREQRVEASEEEEKEHTGAAHGAGRTRGHGDAHVITGQSDKR